MPRKKPEPKKLTPEEIKSITEKNQKYLEQIRQERPPLVEELEDVIRYPKDLTPDGYNRLLKHLKEEHKIDIGKDDKDMEKLLGLVFTFGIDEGVKEALTKLALRSDLWSLANQK